MRFTGLLPMRFPRSPAIENIQRIFFVATGLAVPLYAFPPLRVLGRDIDLATILAGGFVFMSLVAMSYRRTAAASRIWLVAAVVIPAAALMPPVSPFFDPRRFLVSYGHWLLLIAFFFCSLSLATSEAARTRIARWNFAFATLIALFALYQVVGIPRQWPGTGTVLIPFQREPLRLIEGAFEQGSYTRPSSIFLEPAWMGGYLSWTFVLGVVVVFALPGGKRSRAGAFAAAGLALILLAIAASVSWGAYADFAVAAAAGLVSLLSSHRSPGRHSLPAITAVALILALAAVSPPGRRVVGAVSQRWDNLARTALEEAAPEAQRQDSSWVRAQNLIHTARLFRAHPTRGIGLGQFANYEKSTRRSDLFFEHSWWGWVLIAAEMGVVGPFLLLGALVLILLRWRRNRGGRLEDDAVPALLAIAVVQQLHTASFLDLWWWYPVSIAAVLSGPRVPRA
jgi:hypothetical protein